MKYLRYFLAFCLFLSAVNAYAIDINTYLSGSWNNPGQDGHGLSIEVVSKDVSVIYWYVYNPDGSPTFLIAVGENVGDTIHAVAYYNSGMVWGVFDPEQRMEVEWGVIEITFHDCGSATLTYSSTHNLPGIPSGDGQIPLVRLLSIDQMQCANNMYAGIYEGVTVSANPMDPGYYPGTAVVTPDGNFYTFSYSGEIVFGTYTASNGAFEAEGTVWFEVPMDEEYMWVSQPVTASALIRAGHRIIVTFSALDGSIAGTADYYVLHDLFRRGVSMAEIAGNWYMTDIANDGDGDDYGADITIRRNGAISGSDSFGCVYSGNVAIPDPQFNLFEISVSVSDCEEVGGTFTGLGYQFDAPDLGQGNTLRIIVASEQGAAALQLVP